MSSHKKLFHSDQYLNLVFYTALIVFGAISVLKIFYSAGLFVDPLEHLRASYFVQKGLLPYQDFFEHHNPLLWFILAPLTKILEGNLIIVDVVRTLSVLGYFACIYFVYLINAKFIYGKKTALLSTLVLIALPIWSDIANLRPDILMMLCFFGALYLFYSYLEKKAFLKLALSYMLLSFAFLFLQKVLFLIFGLGLVHLWLIYKKEIKIKEILPACFIGSLPLVIFGVWLLKNSLFESWFYYNFTFNSLMRTYYGGYQSVSLAILVVFYASFIIIFKKYSNNPKAFPVFVLTVCNFTSLLYFFPHPQYAFPYFLLASIYFGKFFEDIKILKHKTSFILTMTVLFFSILSSFPSKNEIKGHQYERRTMEYINKIPQNKIVMPITIMMYPIFRLPLNYHWFGYFNVAIVDILHTPNRYFDFDLFLKQTKPDYLIYSIPISGVTLPENMVLFHRSWFVRRNTQIIQKMRERPELRSKLISIDADFWKIDENWIKQNYTQIEGTDVYKKNN